MRLSRKNIAWFLMSLFYAYQYIFRVLPNIISEHLIEKFHVDTLALGQFAGLYYVGYTLAHIPIGVLLDKYGPKFVLPSSICLVLLSTYPLVYSDSWWLMEVARVAVGFGSAASVLSVFKSCDLYYEPHMFARMATTSVMIGLCGAIIGGQPMTKLFSLYGWDSVILVLIGIGFCIATLLFFITPKLKESEKITDFNFGHILQVIFDKKIVLVSILGGLMVGSLEGFADGWSSRFLRTVHSISEEVAAGTSSSIFVGMALGTFMLPLLLKIRWMTPYLLCAASGLIMSAAFLPLMMFKLSAVFVIATLFLIGLGSSYQLAVTTAVVDIANKNNGMVALSSAISNMIIMVFGYFFHVGISDLVNMYWNGITMGELQVYTPEALIKAISIIPIATILGAAGLFYFHIYVSRKQRKSVFEGA